MPEWTAEELDGLASVVQGLCESFALSLSENFNQAFSLGAPDLTQIALDDMMASAEPVLHTTFAYPGLSSDEALLVFNDHDAAVLADLAAGRDGTSPQPFAEEHADLIAAPLQGALQGLGIAIGNQLQQTVELGACTTAWGALAVPMSITMAGQAAQVAIPVQIEGILDGTLRLIFSPDFAAVLAPQVFTAPSEAPALPVDSSVDSSDVPDAPGEAAIDQSEIDRLMSESAPAEDAFPDVPSGGSAAPTMPAAPPAHAFQPFDMLGGAPEVMPRGMELIMDIPLDVTVELGRVRMLIKDVLELATGSIVELERVAGEPVDLLVNGRLVAKGEVVVIEDNFGIRITEIVSPADRLNGVGTRS